MQKLRIVMPKRSDPTGRSWKRFRMRQRFLIRNTVRDMLHFFVIKTKERSFIPAFSRNALVWWTVVHWGRGVVWHCSTSRSVHVVTGSQCSTGAWTSGPGDFLLVIQILYFPQNWPLTLQHLTYILLCNGSSDLKNAFSNQVASVSSPWYLWRSDPKCYLNEDSDLSQFGS